MRNLIIRLVIALLTFGIGVSASALWALFRTIEVPAPAVGATLPVQNGGGGGCRVFVEPPPPPMPPPSPNGKVITGGVLNGKAISKPQPAYPAMGKAVRVSGTVVVQVLLDESGKVISASAVNGHPLLQQASVEAARQARFSPTLLSGQPVKVSGVITYNFVL